MPQYNVSSPLSSPRSALACRTDLHFHWTLRRSKTGTLNYILRQLCLTPHQNRQDAYSLLHPVLGIQGSARKLPAARPTPCSTLQWLSDPSIINYWLYSDLIISYDCLPKLVTEQKRRKAQVLAFTEVNTSPQVVQIRLPDFYIISCLDESCIQSLFKHV